MSEQESFQALKDFLETKPASLQALKYLKEKKEISIIIGDQLHCAVYQVGKKPVVEQRVAKDPDVEFKMNPSSVETLMKHPGQDVGELGIAVLKEVLAGNIGIRVVGSFFAILRNGYIDIIRQGGAGFLSFLGKHGLSSIPKITAKIKTLKR